MEYVFHEKQEGSLCAQHCLNALLQGQFFSAVDLGHIASELDDAERTQMAEAGIESEEYKAFISQGSSNMDDSGFFSVQVIAKALKVWDLELLPLNKPNDDVASIARSDPTQMVAFICNFREHWFTIRKLGNQWFNLNSLLSFPELLSSSYLSLFLTQLKEEGYSIFIITGSLPFSEADEYLKSSPVIQTERPTLLTAKKQKQSSTSAENSTNADEDVDIKEALKLSEALYDSSDVSFQRALRQTRIESGLDPDAVEDDDSQFDQDLEMALELSRRSAFGTEIQYPKPTSAQDNRDEDLERAIALSLQANVGEAQSADVESEAQGHSSSTHAIDSQEEMRRCRQKFLNRLENESKPSDS